MNSASLPPLESDRPEELRSWQSSPSPQDMGISLLIEMAQRGEIDPWDVQVIDVIDRVLEQLNARAAMTPEDQSVNRADLSESGQVFLYASMLVLLKAESLEEDSNDLSPEDLAAEMEDYDDRPDGNRPRIPFRLENQLRRRAIARPLKQRRVTLQELIDQLQTMSQTLADRSEKSPRRRALSRAQTAKVIRQLAHEENLSEVAEKLEKFLSQYGSVEEEQPEWLELEQLLVSHPQCDRVGTFWGLLLLSAQSKVELKQEEFYQDLKIRVLGELSPA
ncbi:MULTISPECIES: segregation/condensation protein A [unclassified Roseofilum]|uniref:segregation/condensation protein A n=1 Tax=unclassified Roseofilum TaxID=2620099 RepID=UPI00298E65D7|nr:MULTISPECIES: segregation/condensation protein A [unclassified Roseofilum]